MNEAEAVERSLVHGAALAEAKRRRLDWRVLQEIEFAAFFAEFQGADLDVEKIIQRAIGIAWLGRE